MTLRDYIFKRNGVPLGHSHSLKNNLYRSFGAKNFTAFWQYWNPIFGYYLGKYVFKPLKVLLPPNLALVITFLCCGLLHDLVGLLVLKRTGFLFANWFVLMALCVLVTQWMQHDFSKRPWGIRAAIHISSILGCLWLATVLKTIMGLKLLF